MCTYKIKPVAKLLPYFDAPKIQVKKRNIQPYIYVILKFL